MFVVLRFFSLAFLFLVTIGASAQDQALVYPEQVLVRLKPDVALTFDSPSTSLGDPQNLYHRFYLAENDEDIPFIKDLEPVPEELLADYCALVFEYLSDFIDHCETNNHLEVDSVTPDDVHYDKQYGLVSARADQAWGITQGSQNIVVAVTDAGVNIDHPDLVPNIWSNPGEIPNNGIDDDANGYIDDTVGWDFFNNDNNPSPTGSNEGHGTHVAGIVGAAGNNGVGVSGVAWNVSLMPVRFLGGNGGGTTAGAVSAIYYAIDNGADIINASWGGGNFSPVLETAVGAANSAGVLFVAAAGNSALNNDINEHYPSNFEFPNVISVAATNENNFLAGFSNFGAQGVHLAAPGDQIPSTWIGLSDEGNPLYKFLSGTSMAAPHVSGLAALMLSVNPSLTPKQIRDILIDSSRAVSSLSGSVRSGGLIDANAAVRIAAGLDPLEPSPTADDIDINVRLDGIRRNGQTRNSIRSGRRALASIDSSGDVTGEAVTLQMYIDNVACSAPLAQVVMDDSGLTGVQFRVPRVRGPIVSSIRVEATINGSTSSSEDTRVKTSRIRRAGQRAQSASSVQQRICNRATRSASVQ